MQNYILQQFEETQKVTAALIKDSAFLALIDQVSNICVAAYQKGGRILAAGNGGSAADAQHIVAELVSRFYFDRPALAAEALTVNTSILTAIGNDYGYELLFSRQIEANARLGDIFFALSTSGNSPNILKAIEAAKKIGVIVVGLTGEKGGKMAALCDYCFRAPSSETPRIQEVHIKVGHIICALIEEKIFGKDRPH